MNRDIEFRGKAKYERTLMNDTKIKRGQTVYGVLIKDVAIKNDDPHVFIAVFVFTGDGCTECGAPVMDIVEVIPETVGQYTGLKDKNGAKIFEGDIVLYKDMKFVVRWDNDKAGFFVGKDRYWMMNDMNLEVIGNNHDNRELLGE
jgi:uncharacterized phage protein (TIGR01671 family)